MSDAPQVQKGWPYEHRSAPLASRRLFLQRLAQHGGIAVALVLVSLLIGTVGFNACAGQSRIDAFLNAAMLLGGMGPVGNIEGDGGKLFAALYALYAGLVFLIVAGILFAPALHRLLHRFHLDREAHRRAR